MANVETLGDGVTIYPDALPPMLKEVVRRTVEENPELTIEEAVGEAFLDIELMMDVGKIALREHSR